MSNEIKKRDILATDVILRQIAPLPIQPIGKDTGLIGAFFENWKLEQRAKSTALIAQISANQNATVQSHAQSMLTMLTFSERHKTEISLLQSQRDIAQEELVEKRLKNKILYHEAESSELDSKIKLKNFRDLYGTSKSEDSDDA
jgi:hypothetical protein